ncbi:MAG TPA: metallophosphoesterase family protein [Lunatimonas sp.]|nr:metallophosphoesterase family protein [Lunatimonas sp.]
MLIITILLSLFSPFSKDVYLDSFPAPRQEFWFWNQTDLPRNAATRTDPQTIYLTDFRQFQEAELSSQNLFNQPVSAIFTPFSNETDFYTKPFALEFLLLNHVNQPVGFQVSMDYSDSQSLQVGVFGREIQLEVTHDQKNQRETRPLKPWKSYWSHLIINYTGNEIQLFHQGEKIASLKSIDFGPDTELILKGFLENEPYMQLHDLIKQTARYGTSYTPKEAQSRFSYLQEHILTGKLFPEKFHLLAGPYLNNMTDDSAQLVWETDQPAIGMIAYGEKFPLDLSIPIEENSAMVRNAVIENLKPGTTYYYQVSLSNTRGETFQTPVLTFQTVKHRPSPIMFGIISDTESRPHINNRVAQLMWDERPDFLIHLGDLTDGGKKENKFQWTMEYFQGVGPLTTRIPIATVPGNGDDDLYWYSQYHPQSGEKAYYRFDYGEASFWMLNSNLKNELQTGGSQYDWLKRELGESQAKWKFVVLHHAPYSSDEDDYGNTWAGPGTFGDTSLRNLVALLEDHSVDMVFYGHLHTYMRTNPIYRGEVSSDNGIVYMQVGGAGGNLEDNAPTRTWFAAKNYRGHHYSTVQLVADTLEVRTYNLTGSIIDVFFLKK